MSRIMRCDKDHQFMAEDGDGHEFQGKHAGCGGRIVSCSATIDPKDGEVYNCVICGAPEQAHYSNEMREEMTSRKLCFMCNFWQEKIQWRKENRPDCFVIEGNHYKVNPDAPNDSFQGFGGSKFVIQPLDGREAIITRNLWHQGDVPERFKEALPDNAIFVR
jgi:hypothetical protein